MNRKKKRYTPHHRDTNCPCCQRAAKGPIQYALLELRKHQYILLEADEVALLDNWVRSGSGDDNREEPTFPIIEPPEGNPLVLAYGVLRPQADSDVTNWTAELQTHIEYGHATIEDGKMYCSCYLDFLIYLEHADDANRIPCALLLNTPLDLNKRKDYGFGYNAYLRFGNMGALTNILNRPYVFCLRGTETSFDPAEKGNWKQYIDMTKLLKTAGELW